MRVLALARVAPLARKMSKNYALSSGQYLPSTAACSFCFLNCCMAGLVIEGAESELLASPLAIINSSSEPIDPDVNLKRRKQNQKHERTGP